MSGPIPHPHGPAFPCDDFAAQHCPGMNLRDWFAGQAFQAAWEALASGHYEGGNATIAKCAYEFADAMLAERAK